MKQKLTLNIADTSINVITDESEESVDYIVGVIDRKMREIMLKSRRCSKNEAALLCALEFCADRLKNKEYIEELEADLDAADGEVRRLADRVDALEAEIEKLEEEKRAILARAEEAVAEDGGNGDGDGGDGNDGDGDMICDVDDGDEYGLDGDASDSNEAEKKASDGERASVAETKRPYTDPKKNAKRNRVGSMFDLLTFSDI